MLYKQKYIKYKLKYLKLSLINWPEQNYLIKKDDILEVIVDDVTKEIIDRIENEHIKNYGADKGYSPYKLTTSGIVRYNNEKSIELYSDDGETVFNSKDFPNGITFKKIDVIQNNLDINKIREQIIELEKKFKQLENNLDNHYHEVPTTGIRYFNEGQKGPIPDYKSTIKKQYPSIIQQPTIVEKNSKTGNYNATIEQEKEKPTIVEKSLRLCNFNEGDVIVDSIEGYSILYEITSGGELHLIRDIRHHLIDPDDELNWTDNSYEKYESCNKDPKYFKKSNVYTDPQSLVNTFSRKWWYDSDIKETLINFKKKFNIVKSEDKEKYKSFINEFDFLIEKYGKKNDTTV